jgi:hypothetical protein
MSPEQYERAYAEVARLLEAGEVEEASSVLRDVGDYSAPASTVEPSYVAWFAELASRVYTCSGRLEEAAAAVEVCERAVVEGADPEPAVHAFAQLLRAMLDAEDEAGVVAFVGRALGALDRVEAWLSEPEAAEDPDRVDLIDSANSIRILAGEVAFDEGDDDVADRHFERACEDAIAIGSHADAAYAAGRLAVLRCDRDPAAALDAVELSLRLAAAGDLDVDDDIHQVRVVASYQLGRKADVIRYAQDAARAYVGERSARAYRVRLLAIAVDPGPMPTKDLALVVSELASEGDPELQEMRARAVLELAARWGSNGRALDAATLLEEAGSLFVDVEDAELAALRPRLIEMLRVTLGQDYATDVFNADVRSSERSRMFRAARSAILRATPETTNAVLEALERIGYVPVTEAERVDVAILRGYRAAWRPASTSGSTLAVLRESTRVFAEVRASSTVDAQTRVLAAMGAALFGAASGSREIAAEAIAELGDDDVVAERIGLDMYEGLLAAVAEGVTARPSSTAVKQALDRCLPAFVALEAMRFRMTDAEARSALLSKRTRASAAMVLLLAENAENATLHAQLVAVVAASGWHDTSEGDPPDLRSLDLSDPLGRAVPEVSIPPVPVSARLLLGGEGVALRPPPWLRMPDGDIALREATLTAAERYGIPLNELRSPGIVDLGV